MGGVPQRILCMGATGSGKSTLARELGRITGIPVHYVDEEFGWLPGWVNRGVAEQKRLALETAAAERWIFDSAYGSYRAEVSACAELVLCLDYPRWVSLRRLLFRSVRRVATREQVCNGNLEIWGRLLGRDSIVRWHFTSFSAKRRHMRELEKRLGPERVLRFSRPRHAERWLASVEASHL
ncbi:adenylate kinase [Paeniglutamicibacter sp. R2-26]|uniref:adenylate kinase n=1 Tax=Paeniglutamicibacter sp. R2-26 TaxID=3144417 RepID=UPI003EE60C92